MLLTINRFAPGTKNGSFGALFIDGTLFGPTMEPVVPVIPLTTITNPWPVLPVYSKTWTLKLDEESALWIAWKVKSPMPSDYNKPENDGGHTLFHPLNFVQETTGCVGIGYGMSMIQKPMITSSKSAIKDFYAIALPEAQRGNLWVEVRE